jgi:hypothetical protein
MKVSLGYSRQQWTCRTRTFPLSRKLLVAALRKSDISVGFTGSGSITSVSFTPRGTTSNMRDRSLPQVEVKRLGDLANALIVTLPSLEKMRASERVVMLGPITSGSILRPAT